MLAISSGGYSTQLLHTRKKNFDHSYQTLLFATGKGWLSFFCMYLIKFQILAILGYCIWFSSACLSSHGLFASHVNRARNEAIAMRWATLGDVRTLDGHGWNAEVALEVAACAEPDPKIFRFFGRKHEKTHDFLGWRLGNTIFWRSQIDDFLMRVDSVSALG